MNTSLLSQLVNTSIGELHGLLDQIGIPDHERDKREAQLFAAVSEALQKHVFSVDAEKKKLMEEAQRIIGTIRQLEVSLDHSTSGTEDDGDEELKVTSPLTRCLEYLKERYQQIKRLHKERFEQVKKLAQALESYSSHLEPDCVRISLPPTAPNRTVSPSFDLSPAYVDKLDEEFARVYEEYMRRVATVRSLCEKITQLWAELGTPQAQMDVAIVKHYRDSPEQLGLHEQDIDRLRAREKKLSEEKQDREKRVSELRTAVESLWDRLGVELRERQAFLNGNRGCGIRQMHEFEDELARLDELKRQNLHLFVEDARNRLQELWDALYLSEDEMLDFTPAFSDIYSDALLEAHEREISRLEMVKEQRMPILSLVERHMSLVQERDELAASSQDASRLMMRGQKGEKRDPGKLLREEKMRKRIAKELPKVTADVRKALEKWEDDFGRAFLVQGEKYLDMVEADERKQMPGPRAKTPANHAVNQSIRAPNSAQLTRANSVGTLRPSPANGTLRSAARSAARPTPSTNTLTRSRSHTAAGLGASPTRLPARTPLSKLENMHFSRDIPEHSDRPESRLETGNANSRGTPVTRAPPPRMRDLLPPVKLEASVRPCPSVDLGSSVARHVRPREVCVDRTSPSLDSCSSHESSRPVSGEVQASMHAQHAQHVPIRQISNTSTVISGSENWETYDDTSEPELDASDTYHAKVRAAREHALRQYPSASPRSRSILAKRLRAIHQTRLALDQDGHGKFSGSEWTDEDGI